VWLTDWIVRIDPSSGHVVGIVDLKGLLSDSDRRQSNADVLNGIAYDGEHDRLFVTGKRWPKLFEIRLVP
jgi:glutaminyl-peptide cyclotransferase